MADTTLQVGARVQFFASGVPFEWFTKASVTLSPNTQEILTVNDGYVGESPGVPMIEIGVDYAVPKSAANVGGLWNTIVDNGYLPAQFNCGGLRYASTGKITNLTVSGGVNEVTSGTFTWRAQLKRASY